MLIWYQNMTLLWNSPSSLWSWLVQMIESSLLYFLRWGVWSLYCVLPEGRLCVRSANDDPLEGDEGGGCPHDGQYSRLTWPRSLPQLDTLDIPPLLLRCEGTAGRLEFLDGRQGVEPGGGEGDHHQEDAHRVLRHLQSSLVRPPAAKGSFQRKEVVFSLNCLWFVINSGFQTIWESLRIKMKWMLLPLEPRLR